MPFSKTHFVVAVAFNKHHNSFNTDSGAVIQFNSQIWPCALKVQDRMPRKQSLPRLQVWALSLPNSSESFALRFWEHMQVLVDKC